MADKDPEDLHQMRVAMRRLRSAISGFAVALIFPRAVQKSKIAKIGHSLGKLRDLDVMLARLSHDYQPILPTKEQKILERVIQSLSRQRHQELKQIRKTINSKLYLHFEQELKQWLQQPAYTSIGELMIDPLLPDLLLPQVSQFLLHPGWLVGTKITEGIIQFPQMLTQEALKQLVSQDDYLLHNLRKSAKKTRYNLELFTPFYGDSYNYYLSKIEQIQEILGQIQDFHVLRKVLKKSLKTSIDDHLPSLAELLLEGRYRNWLQWEILQQEFLQEQTRSNLRKVLQCPLKIKHNDTN